MNNLKEKHCFAFNLKIFDEFCCFSRDYLSVKVWDLHMESKPIETFTVSFGFLSDFVLDLGFVSDPDPHGFAFRSVFASESPESEYNVESALFID